MEIDELIPIGAHGTASLRVTANRKAGGSSIVAATSAPRLLCWYGSE
jgi:hypothetical protein